MASLTDSEWIILDTLGQDNYYLSTIFLEPTDFCSLCNLPWHGLNYQLCFHALANLADLGLIEVIHTPPFRPNALPAVVLTLTKDGGKCWQSEFSVDIDKFILDSEYTPSEQEREMHFTCTSNTHLIRFREKVLTLRLDSEVMVSPIEKISCSVPGFQPSKTRKLIIASGK